MSTRMSGTERAYWLLLRAYPPRFRAEFGHEMMLVFRDRRRETGVHGVRFWLEMLGDVARSAPALRAEAWRAGPGGNDSTGEGTMRPIAILAMLTGAYVMVHALRGGWDGGMMNDDGGLMAAAVLGAGAGGLLVAAGISLLRLGTGALGFVRGTAVASFALCVLVALALPFWSVFARLIGVTVPMILLLVLRRQPSAPDTA